jgi:hypothetical protein
VPGFARWLTWVDLELFGHIELLLRANMEDQIDFGEDRV